MKLVIFDCDGVLVDSEKLAAEVFSAQLMECNVMLSPQECEAIFRGHTMPYCLDWLHQHYPGVLPQDFLSQLADATERYFEQHLLPVNGVKSVLDWLQQQKIPFCVASNGSLEKIHHSLTVTGLRQYFADRCFSANQVKEGKPAPDLFLHAANTMGISPSETVVVEDSFAGVTAALSAGMNVYRYVANEDGSSSLDEKIKIFNEMEQLLELFSQLRA